MLTTQVRKVPQPAYSSDERGEVKEPGVATIEALEGRSTCSVPEAAAVLGIGRSTAYAAAHDGSLPVLRVSNRLLVSIPRLFAMLGIERGNAACQCDCGRSVH
jgi:excisionase family DNA binding protein